MTKRLLIVSPTPFLPSDAGNRVRIRNMIEAIGDLDVEVYVLHVQRERGDQAAMSARLGAERLRSMPYAKPPRREGWWARGRRHIRQLYDKDARYLWGLDDWYDPAITDAVLQWHAEVGFSAVMVEYVFFSALFDHLPDSVLKVLDTHDRFTLRHRLYQVRGMAPKFFSTSYADEARGLSRADLILAIQDREREVFAGMTARPVLTLGHLVQIEDRFRPGGDAPGPTLLIVGSDNEINIDGLNAFLAEDWPEIKRALPHSRLLLAGGVSKHAPQAADIEALGFVEDLATTYGMADVVVNPVRSGTGLNIKSIEALGYGIPLVTTASGSRGIEAAAGQAYLCADDPVATVRAIRRVWEQRDQARGLSINALAFAEDWNRKAVALLHQALTGIKELGTVTEA